MFFTFVEDYFSEAYENLDLFNELSMRDLIIDGSRIKQITFLSSGNFGKVDRCELDDKYPIAIKSSNYENKGKETRLVFCILIFVLLLFADANNLASIEMHRLLFNEAEIMKDFKHENVLPLIGVALWASKPVIIMPFMQNRDLASYLRSPSSTPTFRMTIEFAIQIANGIHFKKFYFLPFFKLKNLFLLRNGLSFENEFCSPRFGSKKLYD